MGQLTKEQILGIAPRLREIEVPEWGGSVHIRPLTVLEQAKLGDLGTKFEKCSVADRLRNVTAPLIQWCVCDPSGNPIFESSDMAALMNTPASVFFLLQGEILKLSGMTREAREELEKNLLSAQNGGSSSS